VLGAGRNSFPNAPRPDDPVVDPTPVGPEWRQGSALDRGPFASGESDGSLAPRRGTSPAAVCPPGRSGPSPGRASTAGPGFSPGGGNGGPADATASARTGRSRCGSGGRTSGRPPPGSPAAPAGRAGPGGRSPRGSAEWGQAVSDHEGTMLEPVGPPWRDSSSAGVPAAGHRRRSRTATGPLRGLRRPVVAPAGDRVPDRLGPFLEAGKRATVVGNVLEHQRAGLGIRWRALGGDPRPGVTALAEVVVPARQEQQDVDRSGIGVPPVVEESSLRAGIDGGPDAEGALGPLVGGPVTGKCRPGPVQVRAVHRGGGFLFPPPRSRSGGSRRGRRRGGRAPGARRQPGTAGPPRPPTARPCGSPGGWTGCPAGRGPSGRRGRSGHRADRGAGSTSPSVGGVGRDARGRPRARCGNPDDDVGPIGRRTDTDACGRSGSDVPARGSADPRHTGCPPGSPRSILQVPCSALRGENPWESTAEAAEKVKRTSTSLLQCQRLRGFAEGDGG
jgi:hypothetical protein